MREDIGTTKYLIHAKIETNGVVERPDVVGAIFGQTEGLLGDELDLRELQKTSRIGRIKVDINSSQGKSTGTILIPSSLDRVETSIIGAALETIDRVGPCEATIKVESIEDVRDAKRKFIVDSSGSSHEESGRATLCALDHQLHLRQLLREFIFNLDQTAVRNSVIITQAEAVWFALGQTLGLLGVSCSFKRASLTDRTTSRGWRDRPRLKRKAMTAIYWQSQHASRERD